MSLHEWRAADLHEVLYTQTRSLTCSEMLTSVSNFLAAGGEAAPPVSAPRAKSNASKALPSEIAERVRFRAPSMLIAGGGDTASCSGQSLLMPLFPGA